MRRDAFCRQAQALVHAETMLLVDDRKQQVLVADILLEQRMRADDDLGVTRGDAFENLLALAALGAAGEDLDGNPGFARHLADGGKMLAGQDFGRRHQHRLAAAFDRRQHGDERHDRLAGTDVALQQPQHPVLAGHVVQDVGDRQPLTVRQREGQGVDHLAGQFTGRRHRRARRFPEPRPHERQRQLPRQEFVIGEPPPGRRLGIDVVVVARVMHHPERGGGRRETLLLQQRRFEPFRQIRYFRQSCIDRLPEHLRR